MKKLLLIAASTAVLSSSAMASGFYLRADVGANKFLNFKDDKVVLKNKKWSASLDLGVGYNFADDVRGEFVFGHYFNPPKNTDTVMEDGSTETIVYKSNVNTIMFKGYYDLAEVGPVKMFVGAGVGLAAIQEKSKVIINEVLVISHTKAKLQPAYSLALGGAFKLSDGIHTDVQYNFSDFGKSVFTANKHKFRAHTIKAGLRFDI